MRDTRPDRKDYYLGLAVAVAARAACVGQKVGAVIVRGERVVSTGYNGAPEGWGNCSDRDVCGRCDNREAFGSGNGYDKCICVHAEMNAITAAARHGVALDGATVYVTHQPCITCAKELVQAGVSRVYYVHPVVVGHPGDAELDQRVKRDHTRLMGQLKAIQVTACGVVHAVERALEQFDSRS